MTMVPPTGGGGGDFKPCPAGLQRIVCCDVVDLGLVANMYDGEQKMQHKVSVRWQSERKFDGKPYLIQKRYTYSLHEKANLRKDINGWRGRALTDEQCKTFDLEKLITQNAYANIIHVTRKGKVYGDVAALMPPPPDHCDDHKARQDACPACLSQPKKLIITEYVRVVERPKTPPPSDDAEWPSDDHAPSEGREPGDEPPDVDDAPEF